MSAGHANASSVEDIEEQLQRLLHSNSLRNATTLQQLLRYLVVKRMEGHADELKEYTIGVEAFGRKAEFDPKTDTIVRVQTHRLRQKLKEYYEQEGQFDPFVVELPKGTYSPVIRRQAPPAPLPEAVAPDAGIASLQASGHDSREGLGQGFKAPYRFGYLFLPAGIIVALLVGYVVGMHHVSRTGARQVTTSTQLPLAVKEFWTSFLNGDRAPIIAYPNAVFLLDESNDLLRFRQGASDNRGARVDSHLAIDGASSPRLAADAGQLYYEDGYTGTGELVGVSMLTAMFTQMGITPAIKTSRNITPEDLQDHCVVLLGSPFQSVAVEQLFTPGGFTFQTAAPTREQWGGQIIDTSGNGKQPRVYSTQRDPVTRTLTGDFSLVSIQSGLANGHGIAIIGGLDTKGTEGATRFMTTARGIEALSAALATEHLHWQDKDRDGMPRFQALIHVRLEKGDQVLSTDLISVQRLASAR